jgi:hypothetical protein
MKSSSGNSDISAQNIAKGLSPASISSSSRPVWVEATLGFFTFLLTPNVCAQARAFRTSPAVMGWTPPDLSASSCQLASFGVSVSATRRSPR